MIASMHLICQIDQRYILAVEMASLLFHYCAQNNSGKMKSVQSRGSLRRKESCSEVICYTPFSKVGSGESDECSV